MINWLINALKEKPDVVTKVPRNNPDTTHLSGQMRQLAGQPTALNESDDDVVSINHLTGEVRRSKK